MKKEALLSRGRAGIPVMQLGSTPHHPQLTERVQVREQ